MKVEAFAVMSSKEDLVSYVYEAKSLAEDEIEVSVTHCGICHSDIHLIDNDWGSSEYPLVPGHEIIGTVSQMGPNVTEFELGQRVGIGWQCASCLQCELCLDGDENLCSKNQPTATGHFGGFAEKVAAHKRFVFSIPDTLPSEKTAPLLCGGITVYSPMHVGQIFPNQHVAVLGIGGLGHLALQFYHAFGCEVTALSSSKGKESEAKRLGANRFICTQEKNFFQNHANSFDVILSTVPVSIEWDRYLSLLKPKGKFCFLGVAPEVSFSAMSLISGNKVIFGSGVGNSKTIKEMLKFADRHQITAQTEIFPMRDVNTALEKVRKNQVRYRAVLTNS